MRALSARASWRSVDDHEDACCSSLVNADAFGFALRISLVLTTSSFFVLYHPADPYPQGSWVFITCLVVSWYPSSMDAASVLKKTVQRIIGTILGSLVALAVGFLMRTVSDVHHQAIVLGSSVAIISFCVPYLVVHNSNFFGDYSYASLLVLLTFGIVVFPFYNNTSENDVWMRGVFRILNIVIGCLLSAVMAVVVFPKPTHKAIQQSLAKQIESAGQASEEVLQTAVAIFSKQRSPIPLRDKVSAEHEHEDAVLKLAKQGMRDFYDAKALYPLLPYDAFYASFATTPLERSRFESETLLLMNRAFRIHATVLLINAIIHNDEGHDFSQEHLELFYRASHLIPIVLREGLETTAAVASETEESPLWNYDNSCALELRTILGQVQHEALKAADDLARTRTLRSSNGTRNGGSSRSSSSMSSWNPSELLKDLGGIQMPPNPSATILLLELVENLILRLLRLHATLQETGTATERNGNGDAITTTS
jgi:hypothetical protein